MTVARFSRRACVTAAACAASIPAVLRAAPLVLRCGSGNVPSTHSIAIRGNEMFRAIERESDGALQIRFFTDDVLGSGDAQLAQLRAGAIQLMLFTPTGMAGLKLGLTLETVGFAFSNYREAFNAYDGAVGTRVRTFITEVGLVPIGKFWAGGRNHILNNLRPVHTPDDFAGMKLRITAVPILVDMFSTLGASPVPIPGAQAYNAVQTHLVDGLHNNLYVFEGEHYYEITKYLSLTGHNLTLYALMAHNDSWRAIPDNLKAIINRNADKYAVLQRADNARIEDGIANKLREQGLTVNTVDVRPFRAKLKPYYARMRTAFGPELWTLLENAVGPLG